MAGEPLSRTCRTDAEKWERLKELVDRQEDSVARHLAYVERIALAGARSMPIGALAAMRTTDHDLSGRGPLRAQRTVPMRFTPEIQAAAMEHRTQRCTDRDPRHPMIASESAASIF
jgi:hypothetical protein